LPELYTKFLAVNLKKDDRRHTEVKKTPLSIV